MSSIVLFDRNGVVAEWHKQAPYTVRKGDKVLRYATKEAALKAARRIAAKKK